MSEQTKPTGTIGDKIPEFLRPSIQQTIGIVLGAVILSVTTWLTGQGLLKPIQTELKQQNSELQQQKTELKKLVGLQQNQNLFWGVGE